jgi:hypothetical protein
MIPHPLPKPGTPEWFNWLINIHHDNIDLSQERLKRYRDALNTLPISDDTYAALEKEIGIPAEPRTESAKKNLPPRWRPASPYIGGKPEYASENPFGWKIPP